jgi:class 3 adenylate cyclase
MQEVLTGVRGVPSADRFLVTILFTDIVGSTQQASAAGDQRWGAVLDSHDSVVRRQLERYRGQEIKSTGDGFLATFDGPGRAIACARAVIDGLRRQGIEIRAGLHTGEVERRGADIGGLAVHIAARVMDRAGGGEAMVSSTVKDLVVGSGIEFEDRGEHELTGVPGTWRLFAVVQ